MKKIIALLLALLLMAACFAGCSEKNDTQSSVDSQVEFDSVETESDDSTDFEDADIEFEEVDYETDIEIIESDPDAETTGVTIEELHVAVKELLGENYLPSVPVDSEYLEQTYGVKSEWVSEYVGEIPMISAHVDTFIAVCSVEGHADDVEAALADYRDYVVENSLQYPSNIPKVNASRIYRAGDYVFYIMLGVVPEEYRDDENGAYEVAVQNNENVIQEINRLLLA